MLDLLAVSNETLPLSNRIRERKHHCTTLARSQLQPDLHVCFCSVLITMQWCTARGTLVLSLSSTVLTSGRIIYYRLLSVLREERAVL